MLIEHEGKAPQIVDDVYVAPTAVVCGDVRIGKGSRILFGAILTADGGPVEIGEDCIVMENALIRGRAYHPARLGDHPFRDGNGRTARLAAAATLLRDGVMNSLQTCVEQHYHIAPDRYPAMMARVRLGQIGIHRMIDDLLGAMTGRSVLAAWVRHRQQVLLNLAASLDPGDPLASVRRFEFGDGPSPLETDGGQTLEPWHRLRPHLNPSIARELRSQLGRAIGDS